jgi:hypothetical protein
MKIFVKKHLWAVIILVILSTIIKLSFSSKFYSETDDVLSPNLILTYKDQSLYNISNDKTSPSYNSKIKSKIREIERKNSPFFNFLEKTSSKILNRAAPSKHSTYAPAQYILFAGLITKELNYNQIKFYSRIPSIFFSVLYIFISYAFCTYVFKKQNNFSLISVILLIFSFPLIYISLRSYNYAAGIFSITLIFLLTYLEMIKKNFSLIKLSTDKINIKNSLYLGSIFALLAYINYSVYFILPIFFIMCFFKHLQLKQLFSPLNFNLLIVGTCFVIFSLPLIIHVFNMNLYQYGITRSTGGRFFEYHLSQDEKNDMIFIILFYLKNSYLMISKNLSFFTDDFFASTFLQSIIFLFVFFGIFISRKESNNLKMFSNLSIVFFVYYFILVYFEVVTLGPSKHTNFYTPLFSILFVITLRFILNLLNPKYYKFILSFVTIFIIVIFAHSSQIFYKKYTDVFTENYIINLIKKHNIDYISNSPDRSEQICMMKNIEVLIRVCPIKYHRYSVFKNLDQINLQKIKNEEKSIMFINDEKSIKKYGKLLSENNFQLVEKIDNTKFNFKNSPLFISKYRPNKFELYIYK